MAVNKYGSNKPVIKEKKVKTEILLEVGTGLDFDEALKGVPPIKQIRKFGKLYNIYSKN